MEEKYDIIVVGSGVAGLFFALSTSWDKKILMITKDQMDNSDSYLAQGGICTLTSPDNFDEYFEDTLKAGHYENNREAVKVMIENSPHVIGSLEKYGVSFDRNPDGTYHYTREAAHRTNRILHHADQTGKEITRTLLKRVMERDNITVLPYHTMIDLLEDQDGECTGIVIENAVGVRKAVFADAVVLATGGIGGLFHHSTNFPHITGDSFALAILHHIELEHINSIQIHPTTLYTTKKERSFLISESVRGEGAILLDKNGERFTDELQPRDVVAAAISDQMKKDQTDHVYIKLVSMTSKEAQKRFPHIFERCLEEGYDITKDMVPITPAQHYLMGGIKVNTEGETSMPRLYAVGETACNGVHGGNRLASNSLLESLVFAERAAFKAEKLRPYQKEQMEVDFSKYPSKEEREKQFSEIIMEEIKRKDPEFYDKWCNFES